MKKLLAVFLAALMLLSVGMVGASAAAGDDITNAEFRTVFEKSGPIAVAYIRVAFTDEYQGNESFRVAIGNELMNALSPFFYLGGLMFVELGDDFDRIVADRANIMSIADIRNAVVATVDILRAGKLNETLEKDRVAFNEIVAKYFPGRGDLLLAPYVDTTPDPGKPAPKTIGKTHVEATFWNWLLYIFAFGWIWMK